MKHSGVDLLYYLVVAFVIAVAAGCGGADSPDPPDPVDISGTWRITQVNDNSQCPLDPGEDPREEETSVITVTVSGNNVTISDGTPPDATGMINGNVLTFSVTFADTDGALPADITERGTITFAGDPATSFTGSGKFNSSFSGGVCDPVQKNCQVSGQQGACSGDIQYSGTRVAGSGDIEPNNDVSQANPIDISSGAGEVNGTVNNGSDRVDIFAITPSATGTFTIGLSGFDIPGGEDLDVDIFASDGTQLGSGLSANSFEQVEVNLDANVQYFIQVDGFETPNGDADYRLSITSNGGPPPVGSGGDVEPNNDNSQANPIDISSGAGEVNGTVNNDSDRLDIFAITPSATGTFTIGLFGFDIPGGEDLDVHIFASDDTQLLDSGISVDSFEQVVISLDSGVLYYILVDGFSTPNGDAAYMLSIAAN
ncbi:MAG: hypothetical protein GY807_13445 [Gammaproteobacteria bacterium]|nr:hypothetical protein [Gammaproteobacteria bacterium]